MHGPILRDGAWWQERDGAWFKWNEPGQQWEQQETPPPPLPLAREGIGEFIDDRPTSEPSKPRRIRRTPFLWAAGLAIVLLAICVWIARDARYLDPDEMGAKLPEALREAGQNHLFLEHECRDSKVQNGEAAVCAIQYGDGVLIALVKASGGSLFFGPSIDVSSSTPLQLVPDCVTAADRLNDLSIVRNFCKDV